MDECVRYVGQREAFGRPIGQHQAIQFTIAEMKARAHAARLAWYDAAARLVAGQPVKKESAIAKLTASNAAMDNARAAHPGVRRLRLHERVLPAASTVTRRPDRGGRCAG